MGLFVYICAFIWGFVLIASFAGYGAMIGRLWNRGSSDGGLAIAWGLSFLVVVGGVLNLTRAISAGLVVGLVLTGVALWLGLGGVRRLIRAAQRLQGWDYLLLAVLLLGYVNWLCFSQLPEPGKQPLSYSLFIYDDSIYTYLPIKMLQTGAMGIDPFNDHLSLSLGGESFLQTLVLAVLPIEYIHLADPGLAYPAIGILILTMRRLTGPARLALTLLFATIPTASQNASAVAIPVVLLVAMARVLSRVRTTDSVWTSAGVALLLAALVSLKSTLFPGGVLVVFLWGVILALITRRTRPLVFGALTGFFALLMVFPWMVCSYQSAGTLVYPYLGEGFRKHSVTVAPHRSGQGYRSKAALFQVLTDILRTPQTLVLLIGIAAGMLSIAVRRTAPAYRAALFAGCGASLISMGLFAVVIGTGDIWRHSYPYSAFAHLIAYAALLRLAPRSGRWRLIRTATYLLLTLPIVYYGVKAVDRSRDLPESIAGALAGRRRFPPDQVNRYRRAQAAVPPSRRFLNLLDWPLQFDLTRNEILNADDIGTVSPPPGIPLNRSPEELAEYLRSAGFQYVVCPSFEELTAFIQSLDPTIPVMRKNDPWIASILENRIAAARVFGALARCYTLLYDDGEAMVIDLESKARPDR